MKAWKGGRTQQNKEGHSVPAPQQQGCQSPVDGGCLGWLQMDGIAGQGNVSQGCAGDG